MILESSACAQIKALESLNWQVKRIKFIQTISMVLITEYDFVKVSDFQIFLRIDFCHFDHVTVVWVKTGAKPTKTIK